MYVQNRGTHVRNGHATTENTAFNNGTLTFILCKTLNTYVQRRSTISPSPNDLINATSIFNKSVFGSCNSSSVCYPVHKVLI